VDNFDRRKFLQSIGAAAAVPTTAQSMPKESDDSQLYALFKSAGAFSTGSSFEVRWSEMTLAALRSAGFLDHMVDGFSPPALDMLWLDKNTEPATLREWDPIGADWAPVTSQTLFGRVPWRGPWQSSPIYRRADIVSYGGDIWIALQPSQNRLPADDAYWDLFIPSIADAAVTTSKLEDAAVTGAKLSFGLLPFDTMAQFVAALIPSIITTVDMRGYYTSDDCVTFKMYRLPAAPSPVKAWHKQSADGGWWSYANAPNINIRMFGAKGSALAGDAATNRAAIQNAIDFKYSKGGGEVHADGFFFVNDTIYRPSSIRLKGSVRHNVLREYGDSTGGVAHPVSGTVFHTSGAGTPRLWTDESGNGTDALLRPLIAELGENGGVIDITLQTTRDANAWDVGLLNCGVSRGYCFGLDVRGAWRKAAYRLDATWGRDNPRMMALAHLPTWFTANYATLYDYGMTNNLFDDCRFEGACALMIESGPNEAFAVNGISDTKFRACEFYNDTSSQTLSYRETDGALIRLNYRMSGLGGAQGLSFESCRFDCTSIWMFDVGYWSNLDVVGGRNFAETSAAWISYQTARGVAVARRRGRIRTNANTTFYQGDLLRFDGEFFCNITADVPGDTGDVLPRYWIPRGDKGRRLSFEGPGYNNTFNFLFDGENGTAGLTLRSWRINGRIGLQNMMGNDIFTWGWMADNENYWGTAYNQRWDEGTVTFQRGTVTFLSYNGLNLISQPIYDDTTANASNVVVETNGRIRRSTSALKYKTNIRPIPDEMLDALLQMEGRLYNSVCEGDDPDVDHMGSIADQAAELGLEPLVTRGADGEIENFKYERSFSALLEVVKRLDRQVRDLQGR